MLLGTAALVAVGAIHAFVGCTTETPRENFALPTLAPGAGGSSPSSGGSAGSSNPVTGGSGGSGSGGTSGAAGSNASGGTAGTGSGGSSGGAAFTPYDCGARPVAEGAFSLAALRTAAADCAIWHYACFEGSAGVLAEHVGAYYEEPTAENLELARAAWLDAMSRWSEVELFQFGPLPSAIPAQGKDIYAGRGIRDFIYSWPSVSRCKVEREIIAQDYTKGGDVFITERGLFALEYLLFYPGSDTECAPSLPEAQTWAGLDADELWLRKFDYALWLAADVRAKAQELGQIWDPAGENFRQQFIDASAYPSEQEALNIMAWALIYVEHEVKDWKLGIPAGVIVPELTPVSSPETPFALVATSNLRANLRGFRSLFQGCGENGEGIGFDDWLSEAGFGDLASRMISAWQGAYDAVNGLPQLDRASAAEVLTAYAAVKELTDLLKAEFLSAGMLKLPPSVEGDTD